MRLDDLTISKVIVEGKAKWLNRCWPAEFDVQGMVRATRMPLRIAAKVYVNVGETDFQGQTIEPGQEGWYYLWWRGLHLLCGMEGLNAGIFKIRPSHESFAADGLIWLKKYRAAWQTAPEVDIINDSLRIN